MEKTLYPNRLRLAAFAAICLIGLWASLEGSWGYVAMAGSGLGSAVFAAQMLPGAAWLKLDKNGFTIRSLFRTYTTPWMDIDDFVVVTMRKMGIPISRQVGFRYAKNRKRSAVLRVASAIVNYDGVLPDNYGMKAAELAQLMETWRQHALNSGRAA